MAEIDWVAQSFDANRARLRAVAYRMLGSTNEAEDAVQEAWLKVSGTDTAHVENLGGWFTTVVARVCLDMLRSRRSRRELSLEDHVSEPPAGDESDPERHAVMADSIGLALLVVLETLEPAERVAFVLHDMFGIPFDEIASIVDRSPEAARQLASRARRRVQGADVRESGDASQRTVVEAFLAAARGGDLGALVALLDPDVVVRADPAAVQAGAEEEVRGAPAVAETFAGRARAARPALIDGAAGLVWAQAGRTRMVFEFSVADGKIVRIDLVADPARIDDLDVALLD